MELSLHGTGYFVKNKTRKKVLSPGTHHVLVLGESTSYGLMLPNRLMQSYPALLKLSLERNYPSKKFDVVNLSYPGQTSFSILDNLELNLLKYKPNFVVLHFGVNDINPVLNPISSLSIFTKIKLLKLIYFTYLYVNFQDKIHEGEHGEFVFYDPSVDSQFKDDVYLKNTKPNYVNALKTLRAHKIPFVILNYFKSPPIVDQLLRTLSKESNAPFIDLKIKNKETNLFSKDNWHPNKKGHLFIHDKIIEYIQKEEIFN